MRTKLTRMIDSHGLRRTWIAEQLGISRQRVANIEHRRRKANPEIRRDLARLLKTPEDWLFDPDGSTALDEASAPAEVA